MLETITPEVRDQLSEIGFDRDEIGAIELIHELKTGKHRIDIYEFLKELLSRRKHEALLRKIDELSWDMGEKHFSNRDEVYDR